jgi:predicted metal-dependent phosphoesterase TrpH
MNDFRADLHCHTTCSDGSFSPEEVVGLAATLGLQGLAITDHDTFAAYERALKPAQTYGIALLPGIEFSAVHRDVGIHVLGYSFDIHNTAIQALCESHKKRRLERYHSILSLLAKHRMPLELSEVAKGEQDVITRPHIAAAMVRKGYVKSTQEAFKKYLGDGRPCYVHGKSISVEQTIEVIRTAGGLVVLAHPHLITQSHILDEVLEMDFDGLECYYANFSFDQAGRWEEIARRKNWLITGGSDFHGASKPQISLGCSWTPLETFQLLKNHAEGRVAR